MSCGYWLRVNNYWLPIEDVQSGVGYGFERARDGFSSVGGVAHAQESLRAARTWTVGFGEQVGPEAVAALMMAAQQDAGDVMLWDESAARANLLDPVAVGAREGYPVMLCDGMPVVSLTSGGTAPTVTEDVSAKANVWTVSDGSTFVGLATGGSMGRESLVKFPVPPAPAGRSLVSSELVLSKAGGGAGTVSAWAASNAWIEKSGVTDYWTSVPRGASRGSGASVFPETKIPVSGVSAFEGSTLR